MLFLWLPPRRRPNRPQLVDRHLETVVFDGSTQAGWYSFPGQSPKLHFKGDQVRIKSREHSTVLLSRDADASGTAAEVGLTRAPKSTSSISGLGLVGDANHAVVIGLGDGSVVLWQLGPNSARVLARQPVNTSSQFEFRVSGGDARMYASSGVIGATAPGTRWGTLQSVVSSPLGRNRSASDCYWMALKAAKWSSATIVHRLPMRLAPRCNLWLSRVSSLRFF